MGTDKRERKKAGHRARLNAERAARARYERRRRIIIFVSVPMVVLMVVGLVASLSESSGTATAPDSSTTAPTTAGGATETAAGKPCVALSDELPAGAPQVDVPIGPPPDSLRITDITTGTGPAVTATDKVTVNYIGVSCSTGAIFDTSYVRDEPATFGLDQVIPGWTEGLQGMQAGGYW